ncbi:hypothetical protein [Streptomyces sp. PvR034]|uniref:hypothetical protein n=1 Tax=Streptomyces sp. PvR034 TaxID=3156401 RepID=UPI0033949059
MTSRQPSRRAVSVRAVALALTAATCAGLGLAPAAHATTNICGGVPSDYTGLLLPETPFKGTVSLPSGSTRAITLTPQGVNSTLVKTEIAASATDSRYTIGRFVIRVNSLGQGKLVFPSYSGQTGETTGIYCPFGTRVTRMVGKVRVAGVRGPLDFQVARL